jgi:predicted AlkP superfamily phosphohydrolase/phosphomutase
MFSPGGTLDWSRTVASSAWTRQQGIRLNVRGREPQGIVAPGAEYERLRDDISAALLQTTEPTTGEAVVDRVWRREELYTGPFYEAVPDLVFALRPDFTASPVQQGLWTPTGWASGDHSLEGMFIAWGRAIAPGRVEGAALIDIAPTALYLLDQPVPLEMDGRVLLDLLDDGFVAVHPVRRGTEQASHSVEDPPGAVALTAEEEADVAARLRGLGYL